jgi:Domain of unknown function (DUF4365)
MVDWVSSVAIREFLGEPMGSCGTPAGVTFVLKGLNHSILMVQAAILTGGEAQRKLVRCSMRAPEHESTSTAALSYVEGDFRLIGWGPMANAFHDLGTDLFIQVRDERRFERGLVVGAQVKGGPSWFEHPEYCSDGTLEGWWFYEPTADHFDDWVTHGLPHLVVLYDFEKRTSYWVHVTPERCIGTGKGCKILVPVLQTVDVAHLDALLDVASAQRAAGTFEQKVFHASAASAPPARRLRYALLTPRLIAPHGNSGYKRVLEPEEYLALLVRRRSFQISNFRTQFPEQLSSSKLENNSDWRWRFVHAVGQWLDDDQTDAVNKLWRAAPNPAARSAAAVVLAANSFESGSFAEAQRLLDDEVERDDASPVDLGWLLVHRAMLRAELGDFAGARHDAARATHSLRGDEDDPTAALMAGVAANILFVTAGFGAGDIEKVINANDTAPAWWRAQTMSWALSELDDRAFKEWLSDDRLHLSAADEGWENLEASRLNALLCADHQAWRSIASRQGRYVVRSAHRQCDDLLLLQGLDQIRRAGDKDSLAGALLRVWETGPVSVLREVAELGSPQTIVQSTASCTIKLWGEASDALSEEYASELASWCVHILSDSEALAAFRERFGSNFRVDSAALKALTELLPVVSADVREKALRLVLSLPKQCILAHDWARFILRVDSAAFAVIDLDSLLAKAIEVDDHLLKDALLRQLACRGHSGARDLLIERAEHDLSALEFLPDRAKFDHNLARRLIGALSKKLGQIREAASNGSFGFGGVDEARLLVVLNVLHPKAADWDNAFAFLSDANVAADHKEGAIAGLAAWFDELDDGTRIRVEQLLPFLFTSKFSVFNSSKKYPEGAWQLQIVSNPSTGEQEKAVAELLSGVAEQRRVAALLLGRGIAPNLLVALNPLLVDEDRRVRASAAFALGRVTGQGLNAIEIWVPAIARVIADSGALMPSSFLSGLLEKPFAGSTTVLDMLEVLKSHASFQVRQSVDQLFREIVRR